MNGSNRNLWPLLGLVALLQTGALFKMVYDRDRLLKTGQEITLPTRPLDPRDIFRGDYVTLGYDISSVHQPSGQQLPDAGVTPGATVYVTLAPDPVNQWKAKSVTGKFPSDVGAGEVVLKGRVQSLWNPSNGTEANVNIRYGIESYFVPEGEGKVIEAQVREHKISAIVAVGADGTAGLKGLVIDGNRNVGPPLL
jgi:uncharacterized membrane-anchored protein